MKIVVSEFMDEAALKDFGSGFTVIYDPELVDQPETLKQHLRDADAIIVRNRTQVNAQMLADAPNLKAVGRLGVGLDNIDLEACKQNGVTVFPALGANANSVAEYVIGAALYLVRNSFDAKSEMLNGAWPRGPLGQGGEIAGRTMGLIGYGSIAQIVAQKADALGMDILAHDPFLPNDHPAWDKATRAEIEDLLQNADVISLHVPLTPETENLIDQAALARMKKSAVLINTARGGIVDENALVGALRSDNISGAALDVFAQEPLTEQDAQKFMDCPNLILTPHIGGVTYEANIRVSYLTVANVKQHLLAGAK